VLTRIFSPERDEVTGGWRKLHNDELHNLYYSTNRVRMIKSMKMRWKGHLAIMEKKCIQNFLEKTEKKTPLEDLDIGGMIIL
jgi:hypothetical protein